MKENEMSETETAETASAQPEAAVGNPQPELVENPAAAKASREAAKYRARAKELEGQLEQATALLSSTRRSVVESYNTSDRAPSKLLPDALTDQLDNGLDVSQFFDEHGFNTKVFDQWSTDIIKAHQYMSAFQAPVIPTQADVPKYEPHIGDAFGNAIMGAR
jgi:hypothetical protein